MPLALVFFFSSTAVTPAVTPLRRTNPPVNPMEDKLLQLEVEPVHCDTRSQVIKHDLQHINE